MLSWRRVVRSEPTYDAYAERRPRRLVRLAFVVYRLDDESGQYHFTGDHELVDTNGWSARQWIGRLGSDAGLRWLGRRLVAANHALWDRIGPPERE